MSRNRIHTRILHAPLAACLQGARLDSYTEGQESLILELQAFAASGPAELFEREGTIFEHLRGHFSPARITFAGVAELNGNSFYRDMSRLPADSPSRTIVDLLSWRPPGRDEAFFLLYLLAQEADDLQFFARLLTFERLPGDPQPVGLQRDWSSPPPMPDRLVPRPRAVHHRFGGDPVRVTLGGRAFQHRLFIGGLDSQTLRRPEVDAVLNLGEEASRWTDLEGPHPADRWSHKGEGQAGMSLDEIRQEAGWVVERLLAGQRLLVHCVAGLNRSVTICCAALILLEGLRAKEALERVRVHHPWARPDSHHWLKLRWLAHQA
ncbi:MAG: dual specificity protein phosphatase family protein [Anaerolineales bacterium]|nr:dual specificity protein phosphatase family protein [Anaerolineales bacterium]